MLSYKILSAVSYIMLFSFGYLIAELLSEKFGKLNDWKFLKWARIILLIIGTRELNPVWFENINFA